MLHEACDASATLRALVDAGRSACGSTREEVAAALDTLVTDRLLLCDGERHLALAVSLGTFSPEGRALDHFFRVANAIGEKKGDGITIPVHNDAVTFRTLRARERQKSPAATETTHAHDRLFSARFSVNRRGKLAIT